MHEGLGSPSSAIPGALRRGHAQSLGTPAYPAMPRGFTGLDLALVHVFAAI
jgi:hypothetical protein